MQGAATEVQPVKEKQAFHLNGIVMAAVTVILLAFAVGTLLSIAILRSTEPGNHNTSVAAGLLPTFLILVAVLFLIRGFKLIRPDQALVIFSGQSYQGTVRGGGLIWTNPFLGRRKISLQPQNLQAEIRTQGGRTMHASVVWQVANAGQVAVARARDQGVMEKEVEAALKETVTGAEQTSEEGLRESFERRVRARLQPYGVELREITLKG